MSRMLKLLIVMIGGAALAAVVFRLGLEQRVAGLIAGSGFIFVGLYGVRTGLFEKTNRHLSWAVLGMALVHLLGVALPMLGFRLLHWNEPFSTVAVWGLSGPEFHQLSTRLYGLWLALVLVTWLVGRSKRAKSRRRH